MHKCIKNYRVNWKVLCAVKNNLLLSTFQLCCEKDIQYIMAPYEADAQIAFIVNSGYAGFASLVPRRFDLRLWFCSFLRFRPACIEHLHSFPRDQLNKSHGGHVGVPDKIV